MKDHTVVWIDIPVTDLDRAIAFYSAVLGAAVTKQSAGGFEMAILPHDDNVSGCLYVAKDNRPSKEGPLVYLSTEGRLNAAVDAARSNGGKILQAPESIAPHGFRAIILDSEGNRIALHSSEA